MIVTNTRLLRGQLYAAVTQLSHPDAWDGRYDLVISDGQVQLLPVEQDDEQTAERAA